MGTRLFDRKYRLGKRRIVVFSAGFLYSGFLSFLQYTTLGLGWHDAGMQLQVLSSCPTAMGCLWSYDWGANFLSVHASPILFAISLFVSPLPYVEWLLVLGCSGFACGIALLDLFFERICGKGNVSLLLTFSFLSSPYVTATLLYLHYEILLLPLTVLFVLSVLDKRKIPAFLSFFGLLLLKEDGWMYAVSALFLLVGRVGWKELVLYAVFALVYLFGGVLFLLPKIHPPLLPLFREHWGLEPIEFFMRTLVHPQTVFVKIFTGPGKFLWFSVLALPFLTWRSLPGFAIGFLWLSAASPDRAGLSYFYGFGPTLLLFLSLPFAYRNGRKISDRFSFPKFFPTIPFVALFLFSLLCTMFPNASLSRSPNLPGVLSAMEGRGQNSAVLKKLREFRSLEEKNTFASFQIAAYLYHGQELKIPYKDWILVRDGIWAPGLVVLDSLGEEPLLPPHSAENMIRFFDQNGNYERLSGLPPGLSAWKRIRLPVNRRSD
ncbi:DUF2079 domain-containing protein [Leptospira fletcheri]|uniref:DUF2079 domain-containing protein n=1 Tax=Leptospira fletcheri TaxID=2484981 RepID=A0A4R9GB89_9LEPT|nr:DUF2079 domain-containing protein [Leptospira fletcheri]TGK09046.1 DUF2079 domain-containing protein [Leptospira fletcheri]